VSVFLIYILFVAPLFNTTVEVIFFDYLPGVVSTVITVLYDPFLAGAGTVSCKDGISISSGANG